MKVLDPGHRYQLDCLDGEMQLSLWFVKREGPHYPGNVGAYAGTTQQEVLRALLDRARYVNDQIPCPETEAVISCYETALMLLESRAARVKGRHLPFSTIAQLEAASTCGKCGHVDCRTHR